MSYQTRRGGHYGHQQNVGGVGQRRPVVTKNFVPGGQLNPQNKQGGGVQQANARGQQQITNQANTTPNTGIHFRNQQQQPPVKQELPPTPAATPQQQQTPPNILPQQQKQQQPSTVPEETKPEQTMTIDNTDNISISTDEGGQKKKPFWANSGNKISKRERTRRRNIRLSKMLQPKNAVMILHNLVKNVTFDITDTNTLGENQFRAAVNVDGVEHVGFGRSKILAKNAAAEMALKHFVKHNKLTEMKKDDENNDDATKMDVNQEEQQQPLPWQHVASFALYKLFASWGEDPATILNTNQVQPGGGGGIVPGAADKMHELRPAKKLPDNPETINPLMLINQMLPHAQFEETERSGHPPHQIFSFKCTVDNETFVGAGQSKKIAKKNAAFALCHKILSINYPPDVYTPPLC